MTDQTPTPAPETATAPPADKPPAPPRPQTNAAGNKRNLLDWKGELAAKYRLARVYEIGDGKPWLADLLEMREQYMACALVAVDVAATVTNRAPGLQVSWREVATTMFMRLNEKEHPTPEPADEPGLDEVRAIAESLALAYQNQEGGNA